MAGDFWVDRLAAGGRLTGMGLLAYTGFRLFVFICNFFADRSDARQARLEAREARVDASLGQRLTHLERCEVARQREVGLLREAVEILASELRMRDPGNGKLQQVAAMLRMAMQVQPGTPDDMTDMLGRMP